MVTILPSSLFSAHGVIRLCVTNSSTGFEIVRTTPNNNIAPRDVLSFEYFQQIFVDFNIVLMNINVKYRRLRKLLSLYVYIKIIFVVRSYFQNLCIKFFIARKITGLKLGLVADDIEICIFERKASKQEC
jgi:hypothetical protein